MELRLTSLAFYFLAMLGTGVELALPIPSRIPVPSPSTPDSAVRTLPSTIDVGLSSVSPRLQSPDPERTQATDFFEAASACSYSHAERAADLRRSWQIKFERYQRQSALGDPLALACLAYCYAKGLGTPVDGARAFRTAEEAYWTGHGAGATAYAHCYRFGIGVAKNEAAARELDEQGRDRGSVVSQAYLIEQRLKDPAITRLDAMECRGLLSLGDMAGYLPARRMLAIELIERPHLALSLPELAYESLLATADAGEPEAQRLAFRYSVRDRGRSRVDPERARAWLVDAARMGYPPAQRDLARRLLPHGGDASAGFEPDARRAKALAEAAAAQGDSEAHHVLFLIWHHGHGTNPNDEFARDHLDRGVAADDLESIFEVARQHTIGTLYPRDYENAYRLAMRAAQSQHADACHFVGRLCEEGHDPGDTPVTEPPGSPVHSALLRRQTEERVARSLPWYEHAAMLGQIDALSRLVELQEFAPNARPVSLESKPAGSFAHRIASAVHQGLLRAESSSRNSRGRTRAHLAIRAGLVDLLSELFERSENPAAVDKEGRSLLHYACEYAPEAIPALLDAGVPLSLRNQWGRTVTHELAMSGNSEGLDQLLARGVPVDETTSEGQTALHFACRFGHPRIVSRLLSGGANPNLPDPRQDSPFDRTKTPEVPPLHVVAATRSDNQLTILRLLLDHGAHIDAPDAQGETALHHASRQGQLDAVRFLLERGTNPKLTNREGESPLAVTSSRHSEIRQILDRAMRP